MRSHHVLCILAACGTLSSAQAQCEPSWGAGLHAVPMSRPASIVVFDDGTGPSLFTADGRFVWKFDGEQWLPFGEQFYANAHNTAGVPRVLTVGVYNDGSGPALYAGGAFRRCGLSGDASSFCSNIAKWDGTRWVGFGPGTVSGSGAATLVTIGVSGQLALDDSGLSFDSAVFAMQSYDPDGTGSAPAVLAVAGAFDNAGGDPAPRGITTWNGTSWAGLTGTGADAAVRTLGLFDFDGSGPEPANLVIGGGFFNVGFAADTERVAGFNGSTWQSVQGATFPEGYIPGQFVSFDRDGAGPTPPELLTTSGGSVYVSTPSGWQIFEGFEGDFSTPILANQFAVVPASGGDTLYVGGQISEFNSMPASNLVKWNAASGWMPATSDGPRSQPCIPVFDVLSLYHMSFVDRDGNGPLSPRIVMSGNFRMVEGEGVRTIVEFDPATSDFSPLGRGQGSAFGDFTGDLYVWDSDASGSSPASMYIFSTTNLGSAFVPFVAKWTGTGWEKVGDNCWGHFEGGTGSLASALDGDQQRLFALAFNSIWVLRGSTWEVVSDPAQPSDVAKLSFVGFDPDGAGSTPRMLYVARVLPGVDDEDPLTDDQITEIVRYDGSSWSTIASSFSPVSTGIVKLSVLPEGSGERLYATGTFTSINGVSANSIARYDGANWQAMGSGLISGQNASKPVKATVGGSTSLYILSGNTITQVQRWDGAAWSTVPGDFRRADNVARGPTALHAFNDGSGSVLVAVGNNFVKVNGQPAERIAAWDGATWTGYDAGLSSVTSTPSMVEYDGGTGRSLWISGASSVAPVSRSIARLEAAECCSADFNGVNGVTVQDIFDFLTAWLAGNPSANFNGINGVTVQDIFDFLTAWLAGC